MDFETLISQWANEQGFQTWSQDNSAVLRNLSKWLNQRASQKGLRDWLFLTPKQIDDDLDALEKFMGAE